MRTPAHRGKNRAKATSSGGSLCDGSSRGSISAGAAPVKRDPERLGAGEEIGTSD